MIVRQFLQWLRTAPAGERAEATAALARAYLYSELSENDRAAAEGAMTMLLDDPSPLVRRALSESLASSRKSPPSVVLALTLDQPEIAAPVLERSPLLLDADLVDSVALGNASVQAAIARRQGLPTAVAAAIVEVGSPESCLLLLENPHAEIAIFSVNRMVERFGHLAAIREVLLARDDLPAPTRQSLVAKLSSTLASFVVSREWLGPDRAQRVVKEACEKATVMLAAETHETQVRPLIRHLRETGQLTAGLTLFEESLAELSDMPLPRVIGLVHDRGSSGFRAVYQKAGLPDAAYPAFREAIATMNEDGFIGDSAGAARLKRRMIERVLTRCAGDEIGDVEPLMTLLRRFAAEAAREEARLFCDDLVDGVQGGDRPLVAA
jgi:uncharacterized protein (DUF2336 family)